MFLRTLITIFLLFKYCYPGEISKEINLADSALKTIKIANEYWYNNREKALELYNISLNIAIQESFSEIAEVAYGQIGNIYFVNNEFEKAIDSYNLATAEGKKNESNSNHMWKNYTAECLYNLRKYSSALDTLSIAEKLSIKRQEKSSLMRIYDLRARIYYVLNLYTLSEIVLQKAIKLAKEISSERLIGRFYERLADLALEKGKYHQAIKYYILSLNSINDMGKLEHNKELQSYINLRIGRAYEFLENQPLAENHYKESLEIAKSFNLRENIKNAILALMWLSYRQKKYDAFFDYYSFSNSLNLNSGIRISILVGNVFFEIGEIDSALIYYRKALSITEENQKSLQVSDIRISTLSSNTEPFNRLARIYKYKIWENENEPALSDSLFKYLNAARSRNLYEKKVKTQYQSNWLYSESIEKFQKVQKQIRNGRINDKVEQDVKLSSLKYDLVSTRLENLNEKITGHDFISLQEFQTYLSEAKSSAVIYSLNTYEQYALIVDGGTSKVVQLNIDIFSLQEKIQKLINDGFFKKNLDENTFNTKIAYELFKDLWEPIEKHTALPQNLIIIPDTPVLSLPFDILLSKEDSINNYSFYEKPDYISNLLVNKYNLSVLPSANLIKSFKVIKNDSTLIFANSLFSTNVNGSQNRWTFQPLIYSKLEANKIKSVSKNALYLEKENSTVANFNSHAPNNNIIHLATHAFTDSVFDLFSGLVFSSTEDPTDDGFLMGYEIEMMNLNCDLVTLSACESGRGRILTGEGVLGLPHQFFKAGARSVLMSLWSVDDKLSSELIPLFYKNYLENKQLKNEALGNAKRNILNKYKTATNGIYYSNPFFWASYNLYGDVENNSVREKDQNNFVYIFLILLFCFSFIIFVRRSYFL